jgi:hypothetical protein
MAPPIAPAPMIAIEGRAAADGEEELMRVILESDHGD